MESKSNFLLFILICLAILVGWIWLQNLIWPPANKDKDKDKLAEKKDDDPKKDKDKDKEVKKEPPKEFVPWANLSPEAKRAATCASLVGAPLSLMPGTVSSLLRAESALAVAWTFLDQIKEPKEPKVEPVVRKTL